MKAAVAPCLLDVVKKNNCFLTLDSIQRRGSIQLNLACYVVQRSEAVVGDS